MKIWTSEYIMYTGLQGFFSPCSLPWFRGLGVGADEDELRSPRLGSLAPLYSFELLWSRDTRRGLQRGEFRPQTCTTDFSFAHPLFFVPVLAFLLALSSAPSFSLSLAVFAASPR